jgi:hypothetical protein
LQHVRQKGTPRAIGPIRYVVANTPSTGAS